MRGIAILKREVNNMSLSLEELKARFGEMFSKKFIKDSDFDMEMDPEINTRLIYAIITEIFPLTYLPKKWTFSANHPWRIRIEDRHYLGEPDPHYVFDMGEPESGLHYSVFKVPYLDFHSRAIEKDDEKKEEENKKKEEKVPVEIHENPGRWLIKLWLPDGYNAAEIAYKINFAYSEAMRATLKDYAIAHAEMPIRTSDEEIEEEEKGL